MSFPKMKLGECAEIHSGSTPRTNNPDFWDGDITWVTPKDLSKLKSKFISKTESKITQLGFDSCSTKLLPENSVLFSSRAPIGHVAINTIPMCTNQGFKSFVPKADLLDSQYLYYWLKANKEYLQDLGVGATFKEISKTVIANVEIPLPPLAEQRRIASILDQADELRQKRQQAIEKLDQLLQATFIDMFGDPVSNPKGWEVKKLSELSTKIHSGNTPKGGSENYVDKGIIFLRSQNVWKNKVILEDVAYIDAETHAKMMKSSVKHEDLLMTKTGRINTENSSLGRAAIYLGEDDSANINGHVYLIRIKDGFNKYFILRILTLPDYYEYIRSVCVGGIDKRQLNKEHIENFPIIQPPMELQNKFSDIVQVIESQKPKLLEQLVLAEDLFKTLQQKAFNGTL